MSDMNTYVRPDTLRAADLAALAEILKDQRARSLDVVAPATAISSIDGLLYVDGTEATLTESGVTPSAGKYRVTNTAEEGLSGKLDIPLPYLRRMRAELGEPSDGFALYDQNVNHWLRKAGDSTKYLVRLLRGKTEGADGMVRALLSDSYKRIDNLDVLMAVLAGLRDGGVDVTVDQCDLSERRMYVRLFAPGIAALAPELLKGYRSPFDGGAVRVGGGGWTVEGARRAAEAEGLGYAPGTEPVVFAGLIFKNSETGNGAFTIEPQIKIQICRNGLTLSGGLRSVHLGAKLEAGELEWSERTQAKNLELITSQATDAVAKFLSPAYLDERVAEIERKAGAPVTDAPAVVALVSKKLAFSEAEGKSILDHFILGGQITAGGVMQAVSSVAQTVDDADRADALEGAAVQAMELAAAIKG